MSEGLTSFIYVVWMLASALLVVLFILIVIIYVSRYYIHRKEQHLVSQQKQYEAMLIQYLFADKDLHSIKAKQSLVVEQIQQTLHTKSNKKILVDTLIKSKGQISGEMAEIVDNLFVALKLSQCAIDKLKSKKWYVIASGIKELRIFTIKEAKKQVFAFVNDPRVDIRRQVYMYFISVFGFEGLSFLGTIETPISKWDQIGILKALKNNKNQEIPDVTKWLKSTNKDVVLLTLELVRLYGLLETKETLITLVNHERSEIRRKVISVFTYFNLQDVTPVLLKRYPTLPQLEQIEVFKFLESVSTVEDKAFVVKYIDCKVFEIRKSVSKILKRIENLQQSTQPKVT
ncbi:conserved hypothetical protein [Tenacibaculum sediminilitoris]|uniref:hypothetical protein n=1 Tax=Tenacibaculum sediminilitoris TaxID=1820334 RepID=UPI0038945EFB